jgi:hypothetical protein
MARPTQRRNALTASAAAATVSALTSSAAVYHQNQRLPATSDRNAIAKRWQIEAYRHVNICGEARYAATLFAAVASRAEIGISEPNTLSRKAVWIDSGPEVEAFAQLAPTVRERSKLLRDFMLHYTIAGESYLVARERLDIDPQGDSDTIWEIVAVTEIRKVGAVWEVRHDNGTYIRLTDEDPVIRLWNPDPSDRREAWSPFRSLLPTLREIEWLTKHIFTQVKSRMMSAGVWFVPDNITFPAPPSGAVDPETYAGMNEAEQLMVSIAASGQYQLDAEEVSIPTVVLTDASVLSSIDQNKLIKFWSEIDDRAMVLRSDAVRRFALGMDMPPEQILGSSGIAVTGTSGSAGSVNHWGVWANEEQTISSHIEPALDLFVGALTASYLRSVVPSTEYVVAYDTATLRLRQDRSKEALEWYDRGVMKAEVALRESGFDPESDMMDEAEHTKWLLNRLAGGSATPEQVQAALIMLGVPMPEVVAAPEQPSDTAPGQPGRNEPPSLDGHPYEGPPRVDHDQNDAPFTAFQASCESLVLRALEKYGNRLLNDGKRGRDKDRTTPAHMAHIAASATTEATRSDFDFSLANDVLPDTTSRELWGTVATLGEHCAHLANNQEPYTREGLLKALDRGPA